MFDSRVLEMCNINQLPKHRKILSKHVLEEEFSIALPDEVCMNYSVFDVREMLPDGDITDDLSLVMKHVCNKWIDIPMKWMNTSAGSHTYRVRMISKGNERDTYSLYFGYIIQDDNPDKPYIYMNRTSDKEA